MGQALYRQYRPHSLKEVAGQEHITRTLTNAIGSGRISHAYLFTGPRGVGKTSVARILAHEINQLPYEDDSSHIDIIEIDAASNRRIDEIRELRDKVYVTPAEAKYKVYIIDEVHMLTKEAFNALLKTLEEPPSHVIFILATTDAHKLPETIISRTQRFSFKPISRTDAVALMKKIAGQEKIKVSDDALELLSEHGQGSLRDALSLLDQASSEGKEVTSKSVSEMIGLPPKESIDNLLERIVNGSSAMDIVNELNLLYDGGFPASVIARLLSKELKRQIIEDDRAASHDKRVFSLMADLIEVPASHDPDSFLELALIKARLNNVALSGTPATAKEPAKGKSGADEIPAAREPEPEPITEKLEVTVPVGESVDEREEKKIEKAGKNSAMDEDSAIDTSVSELDDETWSKVLSALKQTHNTLYGVLRMANPSLKGSELSLVFAFEFHRKRISESPNKKLIADQIKKQTGLDVTIECFYDKNSKPAKANKTVQSKVEAKDESMKTVSSIFEGAELLES